ncbi:2-amino-4-hydroxy-6-hydroxymethyldihydropteridine diphosphokinase [Solemya pervernicosa gill symbiont]|uniref:2-amino-4-hydroxy-6-hydroxymethyldihydropteridine diphosphokinase n=2 Tax=Gammaproteobacteria incertae sedis TaxID=118884 RepID=A0A1T2L3P9_9GAMM|nr:2-amino-4-hydroxy-6-hydroxymethyldihydropteridine diphosphokinase [Candidatus Reidiella endopervernicosa]OOZ39692.1 2-amino-4-hydroxy-6-hydroxymethyldihydropteridine diphosphokinase [Solemya pervernicosa gill symbiont]QKQ28101.1 2-amino-4-hydroxy-6-hydroxymethyldihydropteridine diphosphokinase [Candidatus Reidiella endopervernicosa]
MARVFVSLGSNIEREQRIRAAVSEMARCFGELTLSRVYESEAVGFEGDLFYNSVVGFDTDMTVEAVAETLDRIEQEQGRLRGSKRFAPRTLDLDLLLYDDLVVNEPGMQLPRGEINDYAFVLLPLSEIAPDLRHPVSKQRYADLWTAFGDQGQRLWPVDFEFSG